MTSITRRHFLAAGAATVAAQAAPNVEYLEGEQRWVLSNQLVEASFSLSSGYFSFDSIRDLRNRQEWTPPAGGRSSFVKLQTNTATFDSNTRFQLVRQRTFDLPSNGKRLSLTLQPESTPSRLLVEIEIYDDQSVLRYRMVFINNEQRTVKISGADMLCWQFADQGSSYRTFHLNQWVNFGKDGNFETFSGVLDPAGGPLSMRSGAHGQHCAWLALRNSADRGLFFGWEFDGRTRVYLNHSSAERRLWLQSSIEEINHPVLPSEVFETPWAFVGVFSGNWDDASYRTHRFVEGVLAQPAPGDDFPYVTWDSWGYLEDINEGVLRVNAEIAAKLGIELFVVDLGWARAIGDWRPDPAKFPSGMRALSDYVHSLGMKFGLHAALAEAAPNSTALLQNPNWRSSEGNGYFGADSLCLSHQPVREWIVGELVRMIDEYNVDWILQDGENMIKRCTKTNHTHDPGDSNFSNAVDGLNYVVRRVQELRPQALWENCEDGGNMMTFNMVRNYVTSINCDNSGPLTSRQSMYGATYPFPPRYTDRYMPDDWLDAYRTRSFMFGGPWIFMNKLPSLNEESVAWAISEIQLYKSIRKRICQGRVFHLTARPDENRWDAIQSHDAATDRSILFVTRGDTATSSLRVVPRALRFGATYEVQFQDSGVSYRASGGAIIQHGIRVSFEQPWSAEIVYVDAVA